MTMKKMIILLAVICLLGAGLFAYSGSRNRSALVDGQEAAAEPATAESADAAEQVPAGEVPAAAGEAEEEPVVRTLDYEAMYAAHDPNDVVAEIDGRDETWGSYFYSLYSQCGQIENYFNMMAMYYGYGMDWLDPVDDEGTTYADAALENAELVLVQTAAIEGFAEKNGITLDESDEAAIEEQRAEHIASMGEGVTAEEFYEHLESIYLPRDYYERILQENRLYQKMLGELYGENGEKVSEEDAVKYLEENGYVSAVHILLGTTDQETFAELTDEQKAEKRAQAETLIEELRAVENEEDRHALFLSKMEEISEDTGKALYPDGYTYTAGTMVTEFEDAVNALEEFEVSDVVETDYGYHIIMRLPLSPDRVVEYSGENTALNARALYANQEYGRQLQEYADGLTMTWKNGCAAPDLEQYLVTAVG